MCEVSKPVTGSFSTVMASVLETDEQCQKVVNFFEVYAVSIPTGKGSSLL